MRLVDLSCPRCGASLRVNAELEKGSCNYCGAEFMIQDEINKIEIVNGKEFGYQQWRGRQEAANDHRQAIVAKLQSVMDYLVTIDPLYDAYKAEERFLNNMVEPQKPSGIITLGGGWLCGTLLLAFIGLQTTIRGGALGLLWILFSALGITVGAFLGNLKTRNYNSSKKAAEERCKKKKQAYYNALDEIKDEISIIPPDYRSPYAMRTIYGYFVNSRVTDMTQAVNLFENEH